MWSFNFFIAERAGRKMLVIFIAMGLIVLGFVACAFSSALQNVYETYCFAVCGAAGSHLISTGVASGIAGALTSKSHKDKVDSPITP